MISREIQRDYYGILFFPRQKSFRFLCSSTYFLQKSQFFLCFQILSPYICPVLTVVRADILVKSVLKILSCTGISTILLPKVINKKTLTLMLYTCSRWAVYIPFGVGYCLLLGKGSREPQYSNTQWFPRFFVYKRLLWERAGRKIKIMRQKFVFLLVCVLMSNFIKAQSEITGFLGVGINDKSFVAVNSIKKGVLMPCGNILIFMLRM